MATDTIHTVNVVQATLIKCKSQKIEKLIMKPKTTCFGLQNGVFCVRIWLVLKFDLRVLLFMELPIWEQS